MSSLDANEIRSTASWLDTLSICSLHTASNTWRMRTRCDLDSCICTVQKEFLIVTTFTIVLQFAQEYPPVIPGREQWVWKRKQYWLLSAHSCFQKCLHFHFHSGQMVLNWNQTALHYATMAIYSNIIMPSLFFSHYYRKWVTHWGKMTMQNLTLTHVDGS